MPKKLLKRNEEPLKIKSKNLYVSSNLQRSKESKINKLIISLPKSSNKRASKTLVLTKEHFKVTKGKNCDHLLGSLFVLLFTNQELVCNKVFDLLTFFLQETAAFLSEEADAKTICLFEKTFHFGLQQKNSFYFKHACLLLKEAFPVRSFFKSRKAELLSLFKENIQNDRILLALASKQDKQKTFFLVKNAGKFFDNDILLDNINNLKFF